MKKYLKSILSFMLILVLALTLTGCGEEEPSGKGGNDGSEYQGATEGAGDTLQNVTTNNFKTVAKNVFGIEIGEHTGWTLKEAESPNGVNNLTIDYTVGSEGEARSIIESYFNQSLALSKDGVYSYGMNENYTGMVKKDKFETFDAFAENHLTNVYELYQAMWIYDYNDKTVLFSINIDDQKSGISFTLLG